MEDSLIDNEFNETPKDIVLGIMKWWEKKRLLFNLMIIGIALLAFIPSLIYDSINNILGLSFVIQSAVYLIFINCCYCVGWGVQLLRYYYFKTPHNSQVLNYILFTAGTVFTGIFTYFGLLTYLRFH